MSVTPKHPRALSLHTFLARLIWLCVLPLVLLASYLAVQHVSTLHAQRNQQATDLARNAATAMDRNIQARIAALRVLAASPLADAPPRLAELYLEAQGYRASFDSHVILADLSTQMLFHTRVPLGTALPKLPQPGGHAAAPEVLATGQPSVGDMFFGPIAKEPLVAVVVPVVREDRTRFLLLSVLQTRQLQERLDLVALPAGWSLTLLDSKGEVMARRAPPESAARPIDVNAEGCFTVRSDLTRWSMVLEIPSDLYRGPLITATAALAAAILAVTLIGVVAGRLGARWLGNAVRSLAATTPAPAGGPVIIEIETARGLLSAAAAARGSAVEALRESEYKFRIIVEKSRDIIYTLSAKGEILFVSPAVYYLLGYKEADLIGRTFQSILHPDDVAACEEAFRRSIQEGIRAPGFEYRARHAGGEWRWHNSTGGAVHDASGHLLHFQGVARDITEQRKLEEQLRQAQKMESVGRLAGGVAHDYNNMLSVILGYTELVLTKVPPADPLHADLMEIFNAARRSAEITRQLLAFARRQTIAPEVLDLNADVESLLKMLRRLIGEDIDLAWRPGAGLWPVRVDPSQLNQILANLCVNARDAIADIGKITMETRNTRFDEAYCAEHPGFLPGEFVLLAVSDSGSGMSKEILNHLFEPFFTTKGVGQGTGLGLATVYGIVKQNDGFINVYSEPGQGTTFSIYLPRHAGQAVAALAEKTEPMPRGQGEMVLLVEDEEAILLLTQTILERLGYRVLTAPGPDEAIALVEQHGDAIHLLITDVVMPVMNGRELAERLRALCPALKCLFMSGYTADAIAHHGVLEEGVRFLQKPFAMHDLARKVREALDQA